MKFQSINYNKLINYSLQVSIVVIIILCFSKISYIKKKDNIEMNRIKVINENLKEIENATVLYTSDTSGDTSGILIKKPVSKLTIRPIDGDAKDIVFTIQNKNLYDGEYDYGYLLDGRRDIRSAGSKDYRTTKWFPVLTGQGKSLVLSGRSHNRSTWQFMTADGEIITDIGASRKYKIEGDVLQDKTFSKVDLPSNAIAARVYYANYKEEGAENLDKQMQIEYGKVPTNYEPSYQRIVKLPSVKKRNILHMDEDKWYFTKTSNNHKRPAELEPLNLKVGDMLLISTNTKCEIQVTWDKNTDTKYTGTYGVRWKLTDSNPVCERVGDAAGLHFNAIEGETSLTPYENDFDYIYPWSDIKVCAVQVLSDGRKKITYSGEDSFSLDGSVGNIMVEIPKFYCKREVINGYEYLWISPTKEIGFSVDPSFVTPEGEIDFIYIGVYLSSLEGDKLVSVSQSHPLIKCSYNKLQKFIKNTKGFMECDLLSIMTVQKLYLVETAVIDSQSIFSGNVNMPYLLKDKSTSYYAVRSEKHTNRIYVSKTNMTKKFHVGDAVSILGSWKEYVNTEHFQRKISQINDLKNGILEIEFTGEPVDIIQGETGITCIPSISGETDEIVSMSGGVSSDSGQSSFKYRGIENLWGDVWIILDGAYVKNSELYITYPDNRTVKIAYKLPIQKVQLSAKQFGDPSNMIVKRMGFDKSNPLIMFPSEIGNGASTSSYYCDAWYNLAEKDVSYVLTYGGAWDNKGYAGVFNFRATFTKKETIPFNGSRIMLR